MKKKFRLTYNSPVILTFSIACFFIFIADKYIAGGKLISTLFTVPGNSKAEIPFNWANGIDYIRLFIHVFGHADWNSLLGNLAFILLLGPLMEERYGSLPVLLMMAVTAFVTGVINVCFIKSSFMGAGGIAFMLIMLSSISTINKNELPLSFIFLVAVYAVREFFQVEGVKGSNLASIAGGICGSLFAFTTSSKKRQSKQEKNIQKNETQKTGGRKGERKPEKGEKNNEKTVLDFRKKSYGTGRNSNETDGEKTIMDETDNSGGDKTVEIGTIKL